MRPVEHQRWLVEHQRWLTEGRSQMKSLIEAALRKPRRWSWSGLDYDRCPVGLSFDYDTACDLTACVLEAWLDHASGDVPKFNLGEVRQALGDLWDEDVARLVFWASQ